MVKITNSKIRRVVQPLTATCDLVVEGGSLHQIFRPDTDEYSPDRGVSPLTITPIVRVYDPSGYYTNGMVINSILGTVKWSIGGVAIAESSADYAISTNADNKRGRLTVYKNIKAGESVTLKFEGVMADTRNNTTLKVNGSVMLNTNAVSKERINVEIDSPRTILYNPFSSAADRSIKAITFLADNVLPAANVKIWWYKRVGNNLRLVADDDPEYRSGQGSACLVLDCRYVHTKIDYRVVADYIKTGTVAPTLPSERAGFMDFTVRRYLPKYTAEIQNYGNLTARQNTIPASFRLLVDGQIITKPEQELRLQWYTIDRLGAVRYYNYGSVADIYAASLDLLSGVEVGVEADDRGGLTPLTLNGLQVMFNDKILTV